MASPPIRWGILAPGWIAAKFTATLHRNTRSRVVAVGSSSLERAQQFAATYGAERFGSYEQVVSDPDVDAVYVASPHSHHHTQAMLALSAGKPVLVEKAFTQNAAQAIELVAAARAQNLLLMEAMWTRFLPSTDIVRQLLADGALGDVRFVAADHGQFFTIGPEHRLLNPNLAGGALLDLGVYPISFASFVLGAPDAITARGDMTATGVDGQVSAVLQTGAAHALVSATQLAKTPTTATISGALARIEIPGDFYQPQPIALISRDGDARTAERGPIVGHGGLVYQAAHFARLLTDGRTESPLLPLDESVAIMQTMDEIRRQIGLVYPNEVVL
ncbi:MAG TPA: Gfo/Idh/MocA family oxidoreductase [Jatrophihabitantaceae bacterium]|nr:Gfo/Idh/MocA family oxidoreductase [Jatrophihabitantaceae bacterium]